MLELVPLPVDIVWPVVEGLLAEIRAKSVALAMLRSLARPPPEARFFSKIPKSPNPRSSGRQSAPLSALPANLESLRFSEEYGSNSRSMLPERRSSGRESAP